MYQSYWQLGEKPFEHLGDTKFYYPSERHQATLLQLRYAVENRRGAAVLAGAGGSGKSLLTQLLRQRLGNEFQPFVRLVFPQMPSQDLLTYLADELGAESLAAPRPSVEQSVRRIQRFLAGNASQGRHAVVVVDEAHLLDDGRSLEALRLLLNFETDARPQITFLLAGQPPLVSQVRRMPQLEERLGAHCLLQPLSLEETVSYVSHRLNAAGAKRQIFDSGALEALHAAAHGLPRRINRLADLALLVGYAEELSSIGKSQIESLSEELTLAATV